MRTLPTIFLTGVKVIISYKVLKSTCLELQKRYSRVSKVTRQTLENGATFYRSLDPHIH